MKFMGRSLRERPLKQSTVVLAGDANAMREHNGSSGEAAAVNTGIIASLKS